MQTTQGQTTKVRQQRLLVAVTRAPRSRVPACACRRRRRATSRPRGSLRLHPRDRRQTLIGWFTPTREAYAERIAPLLVAPDLEARSGALFNAKAEAVLPSRKLADSAHVARFLAESEALVARALG